MDQHELYLILSVHRNNDAVLFHDLNTRLALRLYKDALDCWSSSSKSPIYSKTMKHSDCPLLLWEVIMLKRWNNRSSLCTHQVTGPFTEVSMLHVVWLSG